MRPASPAILVAAAVMAGCFEAHPRAPADASGPRDAGARLDGGVTEDSGREAHDGGADGGAPADAAPPPDAGPAACAPAEADLSVSVALREGPDGRGCSLDAQRGVLREVALRGDALALELDTCRGCRDHNRCLVMVAGLHPQVARAVAGDLSARGLVEVAVRGGAARIDVRETTRCEGAALDDCDVLLRAAVGDLRGFEDPEVDFSLDAPSCAVGPERCDARVHALAVTGVDPVRVRSLEQGQPEVLQERGARALVVASSAATLSPCEDAPPRIEWAIWTR